MFWCTKCYYPNVQCQAKLPNVYVSFRPIQLTAFQMAQGTFIEVSHLSSDLDQIPNKENSSQAQLIDRNRTFPQTKQQIHPWKLTWLGNSPFSIGNISSNGIKSCMWSFAFDLNPLALMKVQHLHVLMLNGAGLPLTAPLQVKKTHHSSICMHIFENHTNISYLDVSTIQPPYHL